MRIRKHAKSSSLLHATSNLKPDAAIQTRVCPLNQSPWDVITTFSPPSSPMLPTPPPFQEWDNMLVDGCGSSMHFGSVVAESRELNIIGQEPESKNLELVDNALCCKSDGKSWKCRRVAIKGNSLCEHHLAQVRSYYSNNSNNNTDTVQESDSRKKKKKKKKKKHQTVETGTKPLEGSNIINPLQHNDKPKKALGSSSSSSNPYEFYYYSGFGPHWGRKRGGSRCNNEHDNYINGDANIAEHERHETSRRVIDDDDNESDSNKSEECAAAQESGLYIDEDDDGDEDEDVVGGQNAKKRPRKQIKARSLKSLM